MAVQRMDNRGRDQRIAQLERRVQALEALLEKLTLRPDRNLEVRAISKEQARQEIEALYATGETLYMSEVADRLRLPDQQVVEICGELRERGDLVVGNLS